MDLTKIKKFFQIKDNAPFYVHSALNKFVITHLTIRKKSLEDEKLKLIIYYQIVANDKELVYRPSEYFENIEDIIDVVYNILWTYDICPECFTIMENGQPFCNSCYPQKFFWDYGISKKKTETIPTCSICFDHAISNRLECGHFFHLTCFSKYYGKKDVKCPMCRTPITENDRILFLLDY
jgi:hypothetical protein